MRQPVGKTAPLHTFRTLFALLVTWLSFAGLWGQSVTLQWDANTESDLAGYNLYRSTSQGSGYAKVNNSLISRASYTDSAIAYGRTYYYVCTAVNDSGLESGYSNEVAYVSVNPNAVPVALNDSATLTEDSSVSIPVLANDSDGDGDPLAITGVTQPAHGRSSVIGSSVQYVPSADFFGSDSFTYTISDGKGGSATATVSITVNGVNDAPAAIADNAIVPEDTTGQIRVLANDFDPDFDALTVTSAGPAAHGAVTIVNATEVKYVPTADYNGSDSFNYTISDGHGGSATARVQVTVTPVNDPPIAVNDSVTIKEDSTGTVAVLENDSDPDGDKLVVISVSKPAHGTATVKDGTYAVYTPAENYRGLDAFSYTVIDGNGGSKPARVVVTVEADNSWPDTVNDNVTTQEDVPVTIRPLENDSDQDKDVLKIEEVGNGQHGKAVLAADNSVTYTPNPNFFGSDSFSYSISDGRGGYATGAVRVTVVSVNDPPLAVADSAVVDPGTPVTIDVLVNDSDADGDALRISGIAAGPSHGSASIQSGGILYTPQAGFYGTDQLTYRVSDGQAEAVAVVEVTVPGAPQEQETLVFPAAVNTGTAPLLNQTYVGIGLLNSGSEVETVSVKGRNLQGSQVLDTQLAEPLPPKGQTAFLTSEVAGAIAETAAVLVKGEQGPIQGFFMVGDYSARRMDGVGATARAATSLYLPMVKESKNDSTMVQMVNPSTEKTAWMTMELRQAGGKLVKRVQPVLAPGGSFTGTVSDIFGKVQVTDGFVQIESDEPVVGFEVVANAESLDAFAACRTSGARTFTAPHFFVDTEGNGAELKVLNPGVNPVAATVEVFGNDGEVIAETSVDLPAGQLTTIPGLKLLGLKRPPDAMVSGSLRLEAVGQAVSELVATIHYSGNRGRASTTVALAESGYQETVFPQVAQSADGSIYTGLAVFNPGESPIQVLVEAFDQLGNVVNTRTFDLAAKARLVDVLNGISLFGPAFSQVSGHVRVISSDAAVSYAIFGDAQGEFLSTIEGQPASSM